MRVSGSANDAKGTSREDDDERPWWSDVAGSVVGAAAAGIPAGYSGGMRRLGVILLTGAGSLAGAAAGDLLRKRAKRRGIPLALIVISAVGAVLAIAFLRASSTEQVQLQHFIDPDHVAAVPSVNVNQPHPDSTEKPAQQAERSPYVTLTPSAITNPGHPVSIDFSGTGFSSYSLASFEIYRPNNGGLIGTATAYAQDNGALGGRLLWTPDPDLGTVGNDGGWPIVVTDRYSGLQTVVTLHVSSNSSTPNPADWTDQDAYTRAVPESRFRLLVASQGTLCSKQPAVSLVRATGATPGGEITLYYLNPDNEQLEMDMTTADLFGDVYAKPVFWTTANCHRNLNFRYTVVAIDSTTTAQAKGTVFLSTVPPQ